ncbi:LiaI-LiaF-like domain-containing protein [Pedobacter sp. L105]|uniref:LiaF transmembrane domain-containing protein n=1 Tax=Pedobacter sp. L105 TaxID=1641871 RepID=UPI00131DA9C5|nr:LiaF domain-containing protein [Pedobacter sp. L105]
METYKNKNSHANRMGSGLILLVIGLIFFLRNFGIGVPDWVFSWSTFLMAIGLIVGIRHNFRGNGWLIMVLIGGYFTFEDMVHLDLSQYYLAFGFIVLGLILILRPSRKDQWRKKLLDFNLASEPETEETPGDDNDYVDSVNVFSGSKQRIYSKNFKGGNVTSIFGGCELDLTKADFEGTATLDVVAVFGGFKIIIPPNWIVKSSITPLFGGVDDKRSIPPLGEEPFKILKIKGVALFGGVDIRNY